MAEQNLKDHGPQPYAVDIEAATLQNSNFRTALWTGQNLQLTVMSIPVGGDVGLEVHPDIDQFLRLESGRGRAQMGDAEDNLTFDQEVEADWAVLVPAGTWHNITNIGDEPMKLYSIYAPPEHPRGTVHPTQADAEAAEAAEEGHQH
ncbi:cupin domain-containing protein [Deinococcus sp. Marseille-Q6407]|uniref:cupin domain-containing protein n=1 Tax=Deinococcus sp. Marseille-Q6407 TaxID=2969223 RepID=UPI0021C0597B|nr:cupin domain-containing protein [Deinococcus sp. Marseille-Q6407]